MGDREDVYQDLDSFNAKYQHPSRITKHSKNSVVSEGLNGVWRGGVKSGLKTKYCLPITFVLLLDQIFTSYSYKIQ